MSGDLTGLCLYIFLFHIFLKQVENLNCLFYERHGVREAWKRQFVMGVPWVLEAKTPKRPPKTDNIAPPPPPTARKPVIRGPSVFLILITGFGLNFHTTFLTIMCLELRWYLGSCLSSECKNCMALATSAAI